MTEKPTNATTREQALRVARMLGCQGAHEQGDGWMPCGSPEEYVAIKKGEEEYLKVRASRKKSPKPKMVQRTKRLETKSDAYYENRADALAVSRSRGCSGVRTVILAGKKYYAVCEPKKPKNGWENLTEKPITGIATLPGGGIVTGSFSGKSVEEKGFVNFVSRSTDPDVFSNPESARIRARNLGCIGIRRYTAGDGKTVWLPCTNVSDFNRLSGIRGDNSPRNNPRRQGSKFGKKVLGTPIGGSVDSSGNKPIDGDGDGYVASTPGGVDDTRVSPKQKKRPKGEITKGNIDLNNRPVVKNRDGSISTVRSITITEGNTAVVIPTVIKRPNGSGVIVSDREAIKYYQRNGQHLGKFSNIRDADIYARNLHNQQAAQYPNPGKSLFGEGVLSFKGVPKPKKKPPTLTSDDINNLAVRVRQHNAKSASKAKTNLRDLKIVYVRGLLEDGRKEADKRVSKFLSLLNSDKPKDVKYFDDNDLLPLDHPWRNRKTTKKWAGFDDGEYGVKYAEKCCPQVVKRYRAK